MLSGGLARELRENSGYLRDAGWDSTASLVELAANELDRLEQKISQLEGRLDTQSPQGRLRGYLWRRRFRARSWFPPKR